MATLRALQRALFPATLRVRGHTGLGHLPIRSLATVNSRGSSGAYLGRRHEDQQPLVQGEPQEPKIITSTIPGPKSKAGLEQLDHLQDTRAVMIMTGKRHELRAQLHKTCTLTYRFSIRFPF